MRRADRLFQIIQILRRSSRPVTAAAIAAELEVSSRTVYRDIADLVGQRVPIEGAAGFGYLLAEGYDMPPLMLTPDEVEAAVLGAGWVADHGDAELARAARDLLAKIAAVVPGHLRPFIAEPRIATPPPRPQAAPALDPARLRLWLREGCKLRLTYRTEDGRETERTVWPVVLGYAETSRLLIGWCELRQDFRHFRLDRVTAAEALAERVPLRPGVLRRRWLDWRARERGAAP